MVKPGQRVGEYVLQRFLGAGGFAQVWLACHHVWSNRLVAVKIPTEPIYIRNLQREGKVLPQLNHPAIVAARSFDPFADPPYLVMDYVPGTNLRPLIEDGSLTPTDAVTILRQILQGLAHAHANGVIHRDLKPENILIHEKAASVKYAARGAVRIADFGLGKIANLVNKESIEFSDKSKTGGIAGTIAYMAPEQLDGYEIDDRADLYACGIILFEMLTGERPTGGDVPGKLNSLTPKHLDAVFCRAWTRRERRFTSAKEFLAALEAPLSPIAPPPSQPRQPSPHLTPNTTTAPSTDLDLLVNEGKRLQRREGMTPEDTRAFGLFQRAALAGHGEAQYLVSLCYHYGHGVERAAIVDLEWLRRSAESGFATAQFRYGEACHCAEDYVEAVKWLRKAAEQGDAKAQCLLGTCCAHGEGVSQDDAEAFQWFHKAAERGDIVAQHNVGFAYDTGKGVLQNSSKAVEWYHKAATLGYAGSQHNLGSCYETGQGVPQNYNEALMWFAKAAKQGNVGAQESLGDCYRQGKGVAKNDIEAAKWYRLAAGQGSIGAQRMLGTYYALGMNGPPNAAEAAKWYRMAAEQGDARSQVQIGGIYERGAGVRLDVVEATKWYRKAAEQGLADAQGALAACLYSGAGVPRDYAEAIKWCRKAAEQGLTGAHFMLGCMYEQGKGAPQNYAEAAKWYRKAADAWRSPGSANGMHSLGMMYAKGRGVPKDEVEAVKWYRKAAERGIARAQLELAACYASGKGVAQDYAEAIKWYRQAAEYGDAEAQCTLGMCYALGNHVVADPVEGYLWVKRSAEQGYEEAVDSLVLAKGFLSPEQLREAERRLAAGRRIEGR